jgi:hypothetical protein
MSNYGEELAYWYLRLNGFFPITNFVFHSLKKKDETCYNADADILAIRPPNVIEVIKEEEVGLDDKIISEDEKSRYVFVYCEVKTGEYKVDDKFFPKERIEYVFKRFGLDPKKVAEDPKIEIETKIFKKILIANEPKKNADKKAIFIPLDSTIEFIMGRFVHYHEDKYPSRMFFNSSLIQQFIHCTDKMNK